MIVLSSGMAGAEAMGMTGKLVVVGLVLAIVLPLTVMVIRRWSRGERFENKGTITPPTPPDIGGGASP